MFCVVNLLFLFLPAAAQQEDGYVTDLQQADKLFTLGMARFKKGKFDSAAYLLNKGKVYAERTGDDALIASYSIQQSYIHLFREEFEQGLKMNVQRPLSYRWDSDFVLLLLAAHCLMPPHLPALERRPVLQAAVLRTCGSKQRCPRQEILQFKPLPPTRIYRILSWKHTPEIAAACLLSPVMMTAIRRTCPQICTQGLS